MKKTWTALAGIALSTALLFGCSQEGEIDKNVSLSQTEQEVFVGTFIDKANQENAEPSELAKELNKNIAGLEQKNASDSVDALLYSIYQHGKTMNQLGLGFNEQFAKYESEGIDLNNKEDIEKIDNTVVKEFIEQAQNRFLVIEKENEKYTLVADFATILSLYEPYMADDLKAMVKFSKDEFEVKVYDEKNQKMNFDVVAERIVLMEELVEKHPNSYYTGWFKTAKDMYYQLYFGMNGNSITNKDQTLLPEVETHFNNMLEKHKGTEFAKNISLFFDEYKKNGNKVNDNVYVFLLDMTNKEHETVSEQATESTSESNQVKDAIKEAIEENKSSEKSDE